MAISFQSLLTICNPLTIYNKIPANGYLWGALRSIHRTWWLRNRVNDVIHANFLVTALKVVTMNEINTYINQHGLTRLVNPINVLAKAFYIPVKVEIAYHSYIQYKHAYRAIFDVWNGNFRSVRKSMNDPEETFNDRLKLTALRVKTFIQKSFVLLMTLIDVYDAIEFTEETAKFEAQFNIPDNAIKVLQYAIYHCDRLTGIIDDLQDDEESTFIPTIVKHTKVTPEFIRSQLENAKQFVVTTKTVAEGIQRIDDTIIEIGEKVRSVVQYEKKENERETFSEFLISIPVSFFSHLMIPYRLYDDACDKLLGLNKPPDRATQPQVQIDKYHDTWL